MTRSCDLKDAGKAYPRTCPDCGLGPCKRNYEQRDEQGLGKVLSEYEKLTKELTQALSDVTDLAIWMSGSSDFNEGGQAHEGWKKQRDAIARAHELLKPKVDLSAVKIQEMVAEINRRGWHIAWVTEAEAAKFGTEDSPRPSPALGY